MLGIRTTGGNKMKLQDIQIDNTVRSGLNSFTGGVIIRDTKVLITLNLPDGQKTTIEGGMAAYVRRQQIVRTYYDASACDL